MNSRTNAILLCMSDLSDILFLNVSMYYVLLCNRKFSPSTDAKNKNSSVSVQILTS
jgi:hypothetical protein